MNSLYPLSIFWQFVSFAGVGAVATGVHYLILISLVQASGVNPTLASAIGALAGAFVSYTLNYRYTFRSTASHAVSLAKFFIIAGVGLLLNSLVMWIGTSGFHMHYLLSQIIATGLVLIWNFAGNRFWTFRECANEGEATRMKAKQ
ncbi:MAG: GtrA family protein [Pseudomonadota bacterium]